MKNIYTHTFLFPHFFQHLNSAHNSIKFTMELKHNNTKNNNVYIDRYCNCFRNHCWFKTKDRAKRKAKWIILAFLLIILLLTIALVIVSNVKEKSKICLSSECTQVSSEILAKLDKNVDPCTDFYKFACRSDFKDILLPEDVSIYGKQTTMTNILFKDLKIMLEQTPFGKAPKSFHFVKKLYDTCLNDGLSINQQIENAKTILKKVGSWPMLVGNDWKESSWNLIDLIHNLRVIGLPHNYFFIVEAGMDAFNTTRYTIIIDVLSTQSLTDFTAQQKKYNDMQNTLSLLTLFGVDRMTATHDLILLLTFRKNLFQIFASKENSGIYSAINSLQKVVPNITWLQYITKIMNSQEITVSDHQMVYIRSIGAATRLGLLLRQFPKRVQANYIFIEIIYWMSKYISKVWTKQQTNLPLWNECINDISTSMGLALSSWYVKACIEPNMKVEVEHLLISVKEEFLNTLQKVDWLDEPTRANATQKLNLTNICVGYPEELLDERNINNYYYKLKVNFTSYLNAMMSINAFEHDQKFSRLYQLPSEFHWIDEALWATIINAIYLPYLNSIRLPAAYLKNGLYKSQWPYYIKYALVGVLLGHEISHGFDKTGQKYDKNGNLLKWWSDDSLASFEEKAQCFINQYQKYREPLLNITINGVLTQSENIADNTGVKQAYLAYNNWVKKNAAEQTLPGLNFTQTQLFWISYAQNLCTYYSPTYLSQFIRVDPHTPSHFRVVGTLSNMESFAKDFNCPLGTPMNPKRKCTLW
ncbi:hypothetical protein RN001_007576 [Aquatica leii]|uniref:Uncharacterized protein n=1 Tax=Aquatica leii TaxID=1421715 RepID=A0AAN7P330_9COLE|nr:hypothetical protein RN001_007576 [Aquatica leii]